MNGYRIRVWRTLGVWMIATVFIFILGAMLSGFFAFFSSIFGPLSIMHTFASLLLVMVIGAIWGWSIGVVQRWVLRRYLFWSAEKWVHASISGGAVGAVLMYLFNMAFSPSHHALSFIIFLLPISIAQWFVLRKTVKSAWLWILGMAIGGLGFGDLTLRILDIWLYNLWESTTRNLSIDPSLIWIGFLMLLMIPGIVMLHLFIYEAYPMVPETGND